MHKINLKFVIFLTHFVHSFITIIVSVPKYRIEIFVSFESDSAQLKTEPQLSVKLNRFCWYWYYFVAC